MKNNFINGFIAAPYTPMNENGDLDLNPIRSYSKRLSDNGLVGAFICGTTGEGASMTTEEKKQVINEWIRCSGEKLKIIVHVGGTCLPQSVELAEFAYKQGAYATAAIAPHFFKPGTAEELLKFLQPIAAAAPEIPFYYYHMPSMTGIDVKVSEMLVSVGDYIPNFSGVKYTHSDLMDLQQSIEISNGRYEIFHGFDEILICGLSFGLKSAVGSTYNFMPSVYMDLTEAFSKKDMEKARELQQFSVKIIRILNRFGGAVRAGKAIMEFTGLDCGPCRLPIPAMSKAEKAELKMELQEAGYYEVTKLKPVEV